MAALRAGKGIVRMPAPKAPARIGVMLYAEIKGIFGKHICIVESYPSACYTVNNKI